MMKNIKKLIFTDMDGTLLEKDRTVSPLNRKLIAELAEQDIWVLPATGRSFKVSRSVLTDIDFPYYICFNGCVVTDNVGHMIFEDSLKADLVREIINFCTQHHIGITAYQGEDVFYNLDKPDTLAYLQRTNLKNIQKFDHPSYQASQCYKMLIPETEEVIESIQQQIAEHFGSNQFNASYSGGGRLEIYSINSNKGCAVEWLCNYLNVDIQDTIAIGDAHNDIEMLKKAGYSIAMGQSSQEILDIADSITESNASQGWYKALSKLL
ncbi:MAG: HAD family hydrolase [Alphaproteobacteria bacterium]